MWRITAVAGLVAVMGIAMLSMQTTSVHACSGAGWDRIAASEVIVAGQLTSWEITSDESAAGFQPIRVFMSVDRVYKGPPGLNEISFVDAASLNSTRQSEFDYTWSGSAGACGAFNAAPTGIYALMGLRSDEEGTYRSNSLLVFYYGQGPADAEFQRALDGLASLPGAASLPALGSGPAPSTTHHLVAAVVALGAALLAASFAIRFGTGRKT
ncbi:MAG: hypothetical protein J4N95_06540 [Chloroflexi bacterium]|nr:hypothetical protein [Chloroflexota bacterium]